MYKRQRPTLPAQRAGVRPKPVLPADVRAELPPRVPEDLLEIEEAVRLLGNFQVNGQLKPGTSATLKELVGAIPCDVQTAANWKSALKKQRAAQTAPP